MPYETIVSAFDTPEHAAAAVKALKAGGFHDSDISVFDRSRLAGSIGTKVPGIWSRLFGDDDIYKHEAAVYGQTIEKGGTVVVTRVLDSEVAHATGILNLYHPIDIADRAMTTGLAPAAHIETAAKEIAAVPLAAAQTVAVAPKLAAANRDVLRLAEEQLQVGKEMVESGRARVRRYTTEREVEEKVSLHDEHAEVIRRAISDPKAFADVDWADDEIEVVETAEHALVNKTARVVEEIGLKKVGTEHVETIHEKLRRQQAEFEKLDPSGKRIRSS
jgi:uncharacterized protein (TIGR02271 family)